MLVISFIGKTYPYKQRLKALGARWNGEHWTIQTEDSALEAKLRAWCNTASKNGPWIGITVRDSEGPRYTKLPTRTARGGHDMQNWSSNRMRALGVKMFRR